MRIIALINQKGGCGKTTTAVNLSACLAQCKKRVLLIDLDPQGHATLGLGISPEEVPLGMASVLSQESSIEETLIEDRCCPGLDLAPSNLRLAALEQQLSGQSQREERLLWALRRLQKSYDLILIDSPPSLGLLSFNALRAADEVLVPVDASTFSLHGLARLFETLELLQSRTGQAMTVRALATLFSHTRFAQETLEMLDRCFTEPLAQRFNGGRYRTPIRSNVRLREAARLGMPVAHYDRHSLGAEDYAALAQELLQQEAEAIQAIQEAVPQLQPGPCFLAGGVLFTWIGSEEVAIAGDFNDWVPDRRLYSIRDRSEGEEKSQKWLPLAPARSAYRLRINGVWREDPFNPDTEECPFGGKNSILESREPVRVIELVEPVAEVEEESAEGTDASH